MQFIDIRSDTVTLPTLKMRQAMRDAKVGDDVYGEDPTITLLIQKVKSLFKKQAGIFVPSGMMANQLAVMSWTSPGDQIILSSQCHIIEMQNGAVGLLSGVQTRTIEAQNGLLTAQLIEPYIRKEKWIVYPKTSLICVQNSLGNGKIYPLDVLADIKKLAEKYDAKVHTDGARIFNAACASGVRVDELAQYTDSICFCLSKGLCCPYGSILLGTKQFIDKAIFNKKAIGGGIRQGGIFAAAGLIALQEIVPQIQQDHKIAKLLAKRLSEIKEINIKLDSIKTNILFFSFHSCVRTSISLPAHMLQKKIKLKTPDYFGQYRIIVHYYIREKEVELIVQTIKNFVQANI